MPEVAEVAHVCAQLRRNVLGFNITRAIIPNDPLLFPVLKKTSSPEAEAKNISNSLEGSTIEKIGRHGKYFWIRFQDKKVLLMHFGMTGMIKMKGIDSHLVFMENGGDKKVLNELKEQEVKSKYFKQEKKLVKDEYEGVEDIKEDYDKRFIEWPPRFCKMELSLSKGNESIELAFVDARRLGRVILFEDIDKEEDLFNLDPLARQGPDYSKLNISEKSFIAGDPDSYDYGIVKPSLQEFNQMLLKKKKPIKAFLLDQQFFAGVGNWVSDEILYHAKIHPSEVLSQKLLSDDNKITPVVENLYNSIIDICVKSVKVEGNVKQFPEDWLMMYRWGKGRKKQEKPKVNGHPVDFVTVGGRTSCFVPKVQKKLK